MIKFLRALFVAVLLFCGLFVSAQNKLTLDQGIDSLQKNAYDYPFEKVYLHLDKPFYAAGDTIWFKGYVLVGQEHKLTSISYVLNVDLINQQNSIIRSIKLPMVSGLTRGDFALPDTLEEGNYRIRAYTNWMRNSGAEYFFDRNLRVGNAVRNKVLTESDYTYTTEAGKTVTNAVIKYTNTQGVPYIAKEIHFEVNVDGKLVRKDVANTDAEGKLHIKFSSSTPGSGEIHTVI